MAYVLPYPDSIPCIGVDWYRDASGNPCPSLLYITVGASFLAVNFNSRGKVGDSSGCGGLDQYVTFTGYFSCTVDVWSAYRDGVWTSSTTIDVYVANVFVGSSTIQAYPLSSTPVSKLVADEVIGFCGTIVKATITVNDDGTYSIT